MAVSVGGLTESTMKIGREELLTQVRRCALCTIRTASTPSVDARYETEHTNRGDVGRVSVTCDDGFMMVS